eukprot:11197392-Lingulodinium_polyedra.AAC.1
MVTFDGGSRTVQGRDVAAGAAVVWARQDSDAPWQRVLTLTRAIPCGATARAAEAWAAAAALAALRRPACPGGP